MDRKPVGRDEFRDEALRVLWERVANAVLTGAGFDDVANALKPPGSGPELIPSEHFGNELELLLDTLAYLTSSPTPAWMGQLEEHINALGVACEGQPEAERRALMREATRRAGQLNRAADEVHARFRNRLVPLAYISNVPGSSPGLRSHVIGNLASTYGLLRHRLEHVLDATLRSCGLAPAPAWFGAGPDQQAAATEIISVLVSATYEGAALRTDFDPLGRGFSLPTGIDGSPQWWDLAALAHHLILTAFSAGTTTDTIAYRDLPPIDAPVPGYGAGPTDEIIRVSLELLNAKIASDITEPVQFDELVERLQSATDPSEFWPSPNHLWEEIIRQYAVSETILITSDWIDQALIEEDGGVPLADHPSPANETFSRDLADICRRVGLHEREDRDQSGSFANRLALLAYIQVCKHIEPDHRGPRVVAEAIEDCYLALRTAAEHTYRAESCRFGLRPNVTLFGADPEQTDLAFEIMSLLTHSVYEGLLLREGLDSLPTTQMLPSGVDGEMEEWTLAGLAYFAVMSGCLEPIRGESVAEPPAGNE